jgi:hypothetical protein
MKGFQTPAARSAAFFWLLSLLAVLSVFLIKGRYYIDFDELLALQRNPWAVLRPDRSFLYGSILGFFAGHLLHVRGVSNTEHFYNVLAACACIVVPALYYYRDRARGAAALYLFYLTPIPFLLISWLGKSDSLVVIFYAVLFTARRGVIHALSVFLLVLAHKEQGIVIVALHWLLQYGRRPAVDPLALMAVAAALAVHAWYQSHLPVVPHGRLDVLIESARSAFFENRKSAPMEVFSIFGLFWLPLLHCFSAVDRMSRYRLLIACAAAVFLAMVTIDCTRVGVMVALPVYFFVIEYWLVERGATVAEACGIDARLQLPLLFIAFLVATDCRWSGLCSQHYMRALPW